MAKTKNTATTATEQTAPVIVRKIGKTTYMVGIHFSQTSKETLDDKVLNRKLNTSKNKIKLQNKIINRWNIMPL